MVKVEVSTAWISKKMSECEVPTRFLEQKYLAKMHSRKTSAPKCLTQPNESSFVSGRPSLILIDSHWPKLPSFASLRFFHIHSEKKQPRGDDLSIPKKNVLKKNEKKRLWKFNSPKKKHIMIIICQMSHTSTSSPPIRSPPHKKKTPVEFNHSVFCWTKKPKKNRPIWKTKNKTIPIGEEQL